MLNYHFEIVNVNPIKGHKIAGTKDYETKVIIQKDEKLLYEGMILIRKNKEGVFPDVDGVKDKNLSQDTRRELTKKLKEFIKKAK